MTHIIDRIARHTEKKFELIAEYAKSWACKLLEYGLKKRNNCDEIILIDCMCNSGIYEAKDTGKMIEGTPLRVAKILSEIMQKPKYKNLRARCYFNDISSPKKEKLKKELEKHAVKETQNFHLELSANNGNELLKQIIEEKDHSKNIHYLVFYDPYKATIDWEALTPFIQSWSDIIINHMVSDTRRGASVARHSKTQKKYEDTYKKPLEEIRKASRDELNRRIKDIINRLATKKEYYIASCPFYNRQNSLVYDLLLATSNKTAFNLYKEMAWKVFGGNSSGKRTKINPGQQDLFSPSELAACEQTDNDRLGTGNIVNFIIKEFEGHIGVEWDTIWDKLDDHPIFPSKGYRKEIRKQLEQRGYKTHQDSIDFVNSGNGN